ncbi:transposase [Paucibacter sp. APW11]|uniref:Transposase n=1 Tax=Roseateles aquae TaxID=3077235 RepID=A0ABU3PG77_9BURK|nr:transposase [Paucibacter sp. APW11]MDT9001569.1 transposase [Paucibacter sp. APW11]
MLRWMRATATSGRPAPRRNREELPTGQDKPIKHFGPRDFRFDPKTSTALCPAGQPLCSSGAIHQVGKGQRREDFKARPADCQGCALRAQCLRHPKSTQARKVSLVHASEIDPNDASQRMRRAIDSAQGRSLYRRRIATAEPVFAKLRHNKRLSRCTLRGTAKVRPQWQLFCLVHNIEGAAAGLENGRVPPISRGQQCARAPQLAPQSLAMKTPLNQSPSCSSNALTRRGGVIGRLR